VDVDYVFGAFGFLEWYGCFEHFLFAVYEVDEDEGYGEYVAC